MANWQGVAEFVAVAESQSFTRAAVQLNVSTAHISRQVRDLEQRLGSELLYRTTRRVSLTEAGQIYYQHCRPLLDGLGNAERAVGNLQTIPQGLLRITAPVTYGERHITPLINRFLQQHPKVTIHCELTNQQLDLIDSNYDLAIRLGRLENSDLIAKRLGSRQLWTCASPAYLAAHGEPYTLSELSHHQCLVGTLNHWRFNNAGQDQMLRVEGVLRCNSGEALLDAALCDLGIVQLPDYYVTTAIASGKLVSVLNSYQPENEGIWALYPPGRQHSPKVRMLIDYLVEHL
ncbi:MAG: LysR family transcriptional regulator [Thalassolituus sp.]|jgi:DNA-binding transcriptional LysR family regulator|uniref:LysR family transcriptional regulator n=1 Tax=Thalassolituus TaxID=187492 RepID=UPI0023F1BEBD|nr:LysR family transcriptional regulator [Thalassolituus oleivorans]